MRRRSIIATLVGLMAAWALPAYASEAAVQVDTGTGVLHGSLSLPETDGAAMPAVVLISGSGPVDRDGNTSAMPGRNDSLRLLAQALAANGIATVRYDKRGVAQSREAVKDEAEVRIEHYAQDACQWLQWLQQDGRFGKLAVVGHSEGALIGVLAAQQCPQYVNAYVSLTGVGGKASDVIRVQMQNPQVTERVRERSETILQALERGETVGNIPPLLNALYRPSVQPYLISWFQYDAAQEIAKLKVPVLIVAGETDLQVTLADAQKLSAAQPSAQLLVVEGMNHVFKLAPKDWSAQQQAYMNPELPLPGAFTEPLVAFLKEQLGADGAVSQKKHSE